MSNNMQRRYSHKVFADYDEVPTYDELNPRPFPAWSSMSICVKLRVVRTVLQYDEDEAIGRDGGGAITVDSPVELSFRLPCVDLSPDSGSLVWETVEATASRFASDVVLAAAPRVLPASERAAIAKEFGYLATLLVYVGRFVPSSVLPVVVEIAVTSVIPPWRPPPATPTATPTPTPTPALESAIDELKDSDQQLIPLGEGDVCVVCLAELTAEPAARLPCKHVFHRQCIVRWLRSSCVCPVCRFIMPH